MEERLRNEENQLKEELLKQKLKDDYKRQIDLAREEFRKKSKSSHQKRHCESQTGFTTDSGKDLNYEMNIKFCICANVLVKDLTAKRLFQSLCQIHRLNFGSACMSQQLGCNCMFSKNCSNFSIKSYLLVQKTNFQLLLFN